MAPAEQRESYHAKSLLRWLRDTKSNSKHRSSEGSEDDPEIPQFGDLSPGRVDLIKHWVYSGRVRWAQGDGDSHVEGVEGGHLAEEGSVEMERPFAQVVDWVENERKEWERWNKGRRRMNLSAELAGVEEAHVAGAGGGHVDRPSPKDIPAGQRGEAWTEEPDTSENFHDITVVEDAKEIQQTTQRSCSPPRGKEEGAEGASCPQGTEQLSMPQVVCSARDEAKPECATEDSPGPCGEEGATDESQSTAGVLKGAAEGASKTKASSEDEDGEGEAASPERREGSPTNASGDEIEISDEGAEEEKEDCVIEYSEAGELVKSVQDLPENLGSFKERRGTRERGSTLEITEVEEESPEDIDEIDVLPVTPCSVEPDISRIFSGPLDKSKSGPLQNRKSRGHVANKESGRGSALDKKKRSKSGPLPSKSRRMSKSGSGNSKSNGRGGSNSRQVNLPATSSQVQGSFAANPLGLRTSSGPLYVPKHLSNRLSMPERKLEEELDCTNLGTPPGGEDKLGGGAEGAKRSDAISPRTGTGGSSRSGTPKNGGKTAKAGRSRRKKKSMSAPITANPRNVPGIPESPAVLDVTVPAGRPGWMSNSAPLYTRRKHRVEDRGARSGALGRGDDEDEEENELFHSRQQLQQPRSRSYQYLRPGNLNSFGQGKAKSVVTTIESWLCGKKGNEETMRRQGSGKESRSGTPKRTRKSKSGPIGGRSGRGRKEKEGGGEGERGERGVRGGGNQDTVRRSRSRQSSRKEPSVEVSQQSGMPGIQNIGILHRTAIPVF